MASCRHPYCIWDCSAVVTDMVSRSDEIGELVVCIPRSLKTLKEQLLSVEVND